MSFTLADGKRQGCKNLKLDEHGIELCLRRQNLSLPFNSNKALGLRVIKAVNPSHEKENALDTSNISSSSNNSRSRPTTGRKQNKTAVACLIGKPYMLDRATGKDSPIINKNYTFVLRINY